MYASVCKITTIFNLFEQFIVFLCTQPIQNKEQNMQEFRQRFCLTLLIQVPTYYKAFPIFSFYDYTAVSKIAPPPPPPTKNDRIKAADTMKSAQSSSSRWPYAPVIRDLSRFYVVCPWCLDDWCENSK